tara:strand:- start:140509 stop:140988 length:480 start_codon:yes stop_codon:yes gene_type:complete
MFDKLIPWKKQHNHSENNLAVRNDGDAITTFRHDFNELLTRLFDEGWSSQFGDGILRANVDFDEDETGYIMTAELPGFEPDDFDLKVSGRMLTIRAERQHESKSKNGRSSRYGSFFKSFPLPPNSKADGIDANYHSGVLEVRVPKDERTPSKRIEVKAA